MVLHWRYNLAIALIVLSYHNEQLKDSKQRIDG
jgi:hypothetical protein